MALEKFFEYRGFVGEGAAQRRYTFTAYRIPGQSAWFMKGRYMVDFDGAPNCYHLTNSHVLPIRDYPTVDILSWDGPLDFIGNAKNNDGTWASVVLDDDGQPIEQGPNDPFPGYLVSTVPLQDGTQPVTSARRYADARIIPYIAVPSQIIAQQGPLYTQLAAGHTGNFGDAVVGVNLNTNDVGRAVIGDTGNKPEFGEGSFAFGQSINFLTGTFEPEVLYIVWPGTGVGPLTIPDPEVIQAMGGDLFEKLGGLDCVAQILTQIS
jgi:hypothetical protein